MNRKLLPLIALCLFVASCGSRTVLDETKPFSNNCWKRFEPVEFTIPKVDPNEAYRISLTLRYDTTRLTGKILPLLVVFYADSNERHTITPDFELCDQQGKRHGQTVGQYCTVSDTIDYYRRFSHAEPYTYKIKQRTSKYELYGVASLQMKAEKLK